MSLWKSVKDAVVKPAKPTAEIKNETTPPIPATKAGAGDDTLEWHVVKKGDTLSHLAKRYYGKPSLYMKVYNANKDVLKDPNMIKVGQKLRIPK